MSIEIPTLPQSVNLEKFILPSARQTEDTKGTLEFVSELRANLLQMQSSASSAASTSSQQNSTTTMAQVTAVTGPQTVSSTETGLRVAGGLINLAPAGSTQTNQTGGGQAQAPPKPLSSSNLIFNLVTSESSAAYATECRAAVDAALVALGMDPSMFKMSYWEENVGYPGGSYMNRCITVETPEGYRMDFDAAATLRNPRVTAAGIQLLRSGYWNAAATATT
jgi:hypothetical protein